MATERNKLIEAFKAYAAQTDRPTRKGYEIYAAEVEAPTLQELYHEFESWAGIAEAAGLDKPGRAKARGTKKEAIKSLRRARRALGQPFPAVWNKRDSKGHLKPRPKLKAGEMPDNYEDWARLKNEVSYTAIIRLFGTWNQALHEAGIETTRLRRIEPGPELEAAIAELCQRHGEALSVREFDQVRGPEIPSAWSIMRNYNNSWDQALRAAGQKPRYPARKQTA
jgi:hypothetical protein